MARYGMLVDVSRCNGCYNCFLACRDEYCGNDFPPYSVSQPMRGHYWMRLIEKERGSFPKVKVSYVAVPCMQCDDASCVRSAPDGSVYRRPDGIVIIDPEKAAGRKEVLSSCPYRVIFWNDEKQVPQKCTFCAHLLDRGWKEPRCVEACPTGALVFGDLDDPESEVTRRFASGQAEPLHPEYRMAQKVAYLGLPKRFVAGSVVLGDGDGCADGVTVTIEGESERRATVTDNYGDFEVEGLSPDTTYTVTLETPGYRRRQLRVKTLVDVYCGDILLERLDGRGA